MHSIHLNEHDANQGAQSSGEFLGMTGNSGWYLLGSAGVSIMMVIVLWGVFGLSLLLCLFVGLVLCGLSLAYVFALKNNKPDHYDTDFFESALVEAGVMRFSFEPRVRRPANPFMGTTGSDRGVLSVAPVMRHKETRVNRPAARSCAAAPSASPEEERSVEEPRVPEKEPMVTQRAYARLQEQLSTTEELLEDALTERGEE